MDRNIDDITEELVLIVNSIKTTQQSDLLGKNLDDFLETYLSQCVEGYRLNSFCLTLPPYLTDDQYRKEIFVTSRRNKSEVAKIIVTVTESGSTRVETKRIHP